MSLSSILDGVRDRARRKRWTPERAIAVRGEDLAMRYLEKQKYVIVARNYRPRAGYGEVDLIGWDGDRLAFIEVKTRSSDETETPDRAVNRKKQDLLERTAREYAHRAGVEYSVVRFDILTVLKLSPPAIQLFRDAFGGRSHQ